MSAQKPRQWLLAVFKAKGIEWFNTVIRSVTGLDWQPYFGKPEDLAIAKFLTEAANEQPSSQVLITRMCWHNFRLAVLKIKSSKGHPKRPSVSAPASAVAVSTKAEVPVSSRVPVEVYKAASMLKRMVRSSTIKKLYEPYDKSWVFIYDKAVSGEVKIAEVVGTVE